MPKKTPSRFKKPDEPLAEGKEIATSLLKVLRNFTVKDGSKCEGRVLVSPQGKKPVACSFATYPNGDYVVWFNEGFKFHLWALVNEKLRHFCTVDAEHVDQLLSVAAALDQEIKSKIED